MRQLDGRWMCKTKKRRVCDGIELSPKGCVDVRMIMPVNVRPDRRIPVNVLSALAVTQNGATSFDEHQRLMLWCAPVAHIREGVPNVLLVCSNQCLRVPLAHEPLV